MSDAKEENDIISIWNAPGSHQNGAAGAGAAAARGDRESGMHHGAASRDARSGAKDFRSRARL